MKNNNWFTVSKEGLQQLQQGKPKWFALRELVQNAFDENITYCVVSLKHTGSLAFITVEDDAPEGFKDLSHAYTLFAPTDKRSNPNQRGRFNLGEKQVLALATNAQITTTKGRIIFCQDGTRKKSRVKTQLGSSISVTIPMTAVEFMEMVRISQLFIPPAGIKYKVGQMLIEKRIARMVIQDVPLTTEELSGGVMRRRSRPTNIGIYNQFFTEHANVDDTSVGYLYELGLPVCPLDCPYIVDVRQKVPLSTDRDSVPESYLKAIYAEVLNVMHEEVTPETSSEVWVREACGSDRADVVAVKDVVTKRFGEKVAIANPFDKTSIDKALADGYRVIEAHELSKEERSVVKAFDIIKPSSTLFPTRATANYTHVLPTSDMTRFAVFAEACARFLLNKDIRVEFVSFTGVAAQYGNSTLTMNVAELPEKFFEPPISRDTIDIIIHEICHEYGHHYERAYQEALTKCAGRLVMHALSNPEFFK